MVKNGIKWTLTAILIILVIFSISFLYGTAKDSSDEPLKIAWMTTWAERLLEKHDIDGEVVPFLYGPPMVEAALTGEVNALFVGWVPAVSLLSKSDDWIILSRLAYFPMELMARNGSGIQDVKDLEGKKIAVPYATGPYPLVIDSLKENGLDSKKDVTIVNI